jgi:hypothetical protein
MLALPEGELTEFEMPDPDMIRPGVAGRGVGLARGATSVSGVGSFSVVVSSPSGFLRRNIVNPLNIDRM